MRRAVLSVVVPVFNEEKRLPVTLLGLTSVLSALPRPAEIIVVDNGSTDRSPDVVRAHQSGPVPVRLLRCDERGKGAAVRTGVLATESQYVGFCDADLATGMEALAPTLSLLDDGVNVVIGSRSHPDSDVRARHSACRQAGAWAFRRMARMLVPGIGDTQCGYKFFDRRTAETVFEPLRTTGFAFDVEVLARAQHAGAAVTEIPVRWTDVPGSTFSAVRDGYRSFLALGQVYGILAGERAVTRSVIVPHPVDDVVAEVA